MKSIARITQATDKHLKVIRRISYVTWLATYPNKKIGITRKDIESEFAQDGTKEGERRDAVRKKLLTDPTWKVLIAVVDDSKVVGFFMGNKQLDYQRLVAIYVLPKYQNRGIGSKLIVHGLRWLGRKNNVIVNVADYNHKAIIFYQKFGFVRSGEKPKETHRPFPSGKNIPEIEMVRRP